ncbi:MAG: uroporphyrinogen-III C-methyltransferase [Kiritimatiellae bacterium]|nr:uroporphyrinogen-III C-methyltransferase [Kiritimatiellia bacterium]
MQWKVGTRGSALSLAQTQDALNRIIGLFPFLSFQTIPFSSPGDRDLASSLRTAPADFFSRDLDEAVLSGMIDLAVHSAKDLSYPLPNPRLDWFWLPWYEDARDCLVLRSGESRASLSRPVIGVSSDRREAYVNSEFPDAVIRPIRGSIPSRIAQLDAGDFDVVIMAGAALKRLGLSERITEWIPLDRLPTPLAQGRLAVTFRKGNPEWMRLRSCFVKAVRFVGAGVGSAGLITWDGLKELRQADVCLYDQLMDERLLRELPPQAQAVFVGKRCGGHSMPQSEITELIAEYARQGLRVVRLKGGDPGLFGRLSEEIGRLDELQIPYRVLPGVSALVAATTGTGMLLTKRGESRGFTVMTPRAEGGGNADVGIEERSRFPLVLFMSVKLAEDVARRLIGEGWSPETPAAIVYQAGGEEEKIVRGTLATLHPSEGEEAPGLILIGSPAAGGYRSAAGGLDGMRVLLTCSESILPKAELSVRDLGGVPLARPLIRLRAESRAREEIRSLDSYDWVVLTSPSAVRIFLELLRSESFDLRQVPKLIVCGPGCASELETAGLHADWMPKESFSAEGLIATLSDGYWNGQRILRFRSEKAGESVAGALRERGATVTDCILYRNEEVRYDNLPRFDAVFFASASAVESFLNQFGADRLTGKKVVVLGNPTATALRKAGREPDAIAKEATVSSLGLLLFGTSVNA